MPAVRTVTATRYVTPLREGGSMPGLVEADDDGLYVLKFRGAGQGPRALVAELVAGELARALGLHVPEIVLIDLDPALGRAEPDPEIQDLIAASGGRNVGLDFLPGALPFGPGAGAPPAPELAAAIVWFDALMTNVDRTPRNPNLLWWHGRLWLIDHGAALYLQHGADDLPALAHRPFPLIRDHVLLPYAGSIADAYAVLRVVPRVERGERFNAGVVMFCRRRGFLAARVALDERRLAALAPDVDPAVVRAHLDALVRIAAGDPAGGSVAALEPSDRFGWLVAPSSTIIQPSPVHTGLCDDPDATLDRLFAELVAPLDAG